MRNLIKIIKGSFVGMGSILPGISGSMIAAILKIYQDLIVALNDFTKRPFKSIVSIWQYLVGIVIGLGLGFTLIKLFLDIFPLPLTFLFIGFIVGAMPSILKEFHNKKFKYHHYLVLILSMIIMFSFLFIQEGQNEVNSFAYYVIVFVIGLITAVAMITPGLSGATLLMALGYFQILIDLADDIIKAFLTLDFSIILPVMPMLILLMLGGIIGLIFMGKVMYYLLKKYRTHFYFAVFGIILISPFNILFTLQENTTADVFEVSWYIWIGAGACFLLGILLTNLMTRKSQKTEAIYD